MSRTDSTRTGLLALTVAVSAGIHAGLSPEHLKEMPRLGDSFIAAALLGTMIAVALIARPDDRRIAALAGLFCLGQIVAWVLFVTIAVPFFPGTPEGFETIALISKTVEAAGVALALLRPRAVTRAKRPVSGDPPLRDRSSLASHSAHRGATESC